MPALPRPRPEPVPAGAVDAAISILTPYVTRPSDVHQAAESVTQALHLIYEMYIQSLRERLHGQIEHNKELVRTTAQMNKQVERLQAEHARAVADAQFHYELNLELSAEARRMHEELQRAVYRVDEQRAQTRMWKDRAKRAERNERHAV